MHEHGIAQEMVRLALLYAEQEQAARITCFRIEMSRASPESCDSLCFYLETLTRGTLARNAKFEIERVSVPVHCLECNKRFEKEELGQVCPDCQSRQIVPDGWDEFNLSSIEIE